MTESLLTWAEISLDAIAHNVRELRRITAPEARLMAVVKANAYGHGACRVARQALRCGAEILGVARPDEGIRLRQEGISAPILIFGYTPPALAEQLLKWELTPSVYSYKNAQTLSEATCLAGKKLKVHVKADTGMGRLGLLAFPAAQLSETVREILNMARLDGIEIEGIFTHFAASDSLDKSYARKQLARFMTLLEQLRGAGLEIPLRHSANSAGIMELPESHLDMVRAGIALYGLYPSHEVDRTRIRLKPAMTLKSRITHIKKVPARFSVSYGMTYETPEPTTVATVCIGYADGLNRLLSSGGHMLVRGKRAPIAGRVCMDLTMLDVGHIPGVAVGDEVVVFGPQGKETLHVDEIASALNTINYEIVSTITRRVPRIYVATSAQ